MKTILITLVTLITFSLSAQKKETLIYSIKGNDTLRMDVFTPKNIKKTDSLPVLLWMHGGGFSGSHRAFPDDANLVKYAAEKQNYIGGS